MAADCSEGGCIFDFDLLGLFGSIFGGDGSGPAFFEDPFNTGRYADLENFGADADAFYAEAAAANPTFGGGAQFEYGREQLLEFYAAAGFEDSTLALFDAPDERLAGGLVVGSDGSSLAQFESVGSGDLDLRVEVKQLPKVDPPKDEDDMALVDSFGGGTFGAQPSQLTFAAGIPRSGAVLDPLPSFDFDEFDFGLSFGEGRSASTSSIDDDELLTEDEGGFFSDILDALGGAARGALDAVGGIITDPDFAKTAARIILQRRGVIPTDEPDDGDRAAAAAAARRAAAERVVADRRIAELAAMEGGARAGSSGRDLEAEIQAEIDRLLSEQMDDGGEDVLPAARSSLTMPLLIAGGLGVAAIVLAMR